MKKVVSTSLLGFALMMSASSLAFAQDKTAKIGVLNDQSGLYADVTGPGSVLAAQMAVEDSGSCRQGLEDRRRGRRSPEQARYRRQHRASVVRSRQGRHHRRRADVVGRSRRQQRRQGKERRLSEFGFGHVRSLQRTVLAQHHSLGLRHLSARQRHRLRHGQVRRRHLVLPHRGLRLRLFAGARHRRHRQGEGRQGARQPFGRR
jgi:hypothetical protein